MQYANDVSGQLEPAKLCGTLDELEALSCRNIVNPVGSIVTASSNVSYVHSLSVCLLCSVDSCPAQFY